MMRIRYLREEDWSGKKEWDNPDNEHSPATIAHCAYRTWAYGENDDNKPNELREKCQ